MPVVKSQPRGGARARWGGALLLLEGRGADLVGRLVEAGVARQCVGPTSLGIAPRACTILNKFLLLLLFLCLPR